MQFFRSKFIRCIALIMLVCFSAAMLSGCSLLLFGSLMEDNDIPPAAEPAYPASISLYDFSADTTNLLVGHSNDIFFSVVASGDLGTIRVKFDNNSLGELNDAGINGDITTNDGVYSAYIDVYPENAGTYILYAECGGVYSQNISFTAYDMPTTADVHDYRNFVGDIIDIEADYIDRAGNVTDPYMLFDKVTEYVVSKESSGEVTDIVIEDDAISFRLASGIPMVYEPAAAGTLSGMGDVRIYTFEPFYVDFAKPESGYSGSTDDAAYGVTAMVQGTKFLSRDNFDETDVTLSAIRSISKNSVVLWYGHGGYAKSYHSYLITGEPFDEYAFVNDPAYYKDFLNDCLLGCGDRVAVSGNYIRKYCGDLSGSLIFLVSCKGAMDSYLADSFLARGARSVLAFSNTVSCIYGEAMMLKVMNELTLHDGSAYNTIETALANARFACGVEDPHYPANPRARLLLFGDPNYRLSENIPPAPIPTATPSLPPVAPTPTAAPAPSAPNNSSGNAYAAYANMLASYAWIRYCPADLSEIPPAEYKDYWLGSYVLCDIDKNGTDEILILAGQSRADMVLTCFTYENGSVKFIGAVESPADGIFIHPNSNSVIATENHGGMGVDTQFMLKNGRISVTDVREYNYETGAYKGPADDGWRMLTKYSVHDVSPLQ